MISLKLQDALQCALQTTQSNLSIFADRYPDDTTENNVYVLRRAQNGFAAGDNYGWTSSFWPGLLWLAYELTGDAAYRVVGEQHIQNFIKRIENRIDLDTHDIGFLYTLSCVAPYRILGNAAARTAAIQAAEQLMHRYMPKIGVFQAWGSLDHPELRGNTIIDSLMNMPLLYWATEQTGDTRFAQAAHTHATRLRDDVVRPNNTTFHTFYWNVETGVPMHGKTAQGYADDSCWTRGQAWAIYGFALNYRYTADESFLVSSQRCADYFLAQLPTDHIAYWDLVFNDGSTEERDSSAAAIAVCALQELVQHLPDGAKRQAYEQAVDTILASLITNYSACNHPESNALLLHSVYDKPKSIGVDEGSLWGDYFYLEALTRKLKPDWKIYW
jgi:unsaturated chondroitin disaccharide hydrolase